jgi:hypothetical protein
MMADTKRDEISEGQIEEAEQNAADPITREKSCGKGRRFRVAIQRSTNNPAPKPGWPMLEQLICD